MPDNQSVQRIYFILAWAGWIWLVVAAALLAFALWRKKKNAERGGFDVTLPHDEGRQ